MTPRRTGERRKTWLPWLHLARVTRFPEHVGRSGNDRRVSGIVDRRREIHAELAELYHRRSGECTCTCIHAQEHDAGAVAS